MIRLIRLPEVIHLTGLKRSSIYSFIERGIFPAQISLSGPAGRAVGWDESAIEQWISDRIQEAENIAQNEAVCGE